MKNLYNELNRFPKDKPHAFEIFPRENKDGLNEFLNEGRSKGIVINYEPRENDLLINYWVNEVFNIYKVEAIDLNKKLRSLEYSTTKIILFAMGIIATGGLSLAVSGLGALFTVKDYINSKKFKNEEDEYKAIKNILQKFVKESENINQPEQILLACIRLLIEITRYKPVIFRIINPEKLNPIDLQFLNIYYGAFKDSHYSRNSQEYLYDTKEDVMIDSKLFVILDWQQLDPRDWESMWNPSPDDTDYEWNDWLSFRWFLKRYKMIDDLYSINPAIVVDDKVFVGRKEYLDLLQNDLEDVITNQSMKIRKIEGNSGMGKTSLVEKFLSQINSSDNKYSFINLNMGFSYEGKSMTEGLPEIRNVLNKLKLSVDSKLRNNIIGILKNNVLNKKQKREEIAKTLGVITDIESIATLVLELAKFSTSSMNGLLSILGVIGGLMDIKELNEVTDFNKLIAGDLSKYEESMTQSSINDILYDLVQQFIFTIKSSKEIGDSNSVIVWTIDDIQWMDEHSAEFFYKLINNNEFKKLPILLIFLDRPANSISKFQESHIKIRQMLSDKDISVSLKGFEETQIVDILKESIIENDNNNEIAKLAANKLWRLFNTEDNSFNGRVYIEPLFIVESINLIGEYEEEAIIVKDEELNTWKWSSDDINLISDRIDRRFKRWQENNDSEAYYPGFTSSTIAVMTERINLLRRHYGNEQGLLISKLLEIGAFMGEPFLPQAAISFMKCSKINNVPKVNDLVEIENTYELLMRYLMSVNSWDWIPYMFRHSLYRKFLRCSFNKNSQTHQGNPHNTVFMVLDEIIRDNKEKMPKDLYYSILLQAAKHGKESGTEEIIEKSISYFLELGDVEISQMNYFQSRAYYLESSNLYNNISHKSLRLEIICNSKLGNAYNLLGNYKKALEHLKIALKLGKDLSKEEDIKLGECSYYKNLNRVVTIYRTISNYEEAAEKLKILEDAIKKEDLENHDEVAFLMTLSNIFYVNLDYKFKPGLVSRIEKALEKYEPILGASHRVIINLKSYLGLLYIMTGNEDKGIRACEEAQRLSEEVYGDMNITSIESKIWLSQAYFSHPQHRHKVVDMIKEDYLYYKNTVGEDSKITVDFLGLLAKTYTRLDDPQPHIAQLYSEQYLKYMEKISEGMDIKVLDAKEQLSYTYSLLCQKPDFYAIKAFVKKIPVYIKGEELIFDSPDEYAHIYKNMGNQSIKLLKEVKQYFENEFSDNQLIILRILNKIVQAYCALNDLENALNVARQTMELCLNYSNNINIEVLRSFENITHIFIMLENWDAAKLYAEKYLRLSRQGGSYDRFKKTESILAEINNKISVEVKIGRNDKCLCGSGKKFKKCCYQFVQ